MANAAGGDGSTVGPGSRTDALVPDRVREFSRLLERLFEQLLPLPEHELDDALTAALGEVSEFLGTDRGFVLRYDHDAQTTTMTHEWCGPGIPAAIEREQNQPFDLHPQEQARLLRHEINEIRDVALLGDGWEHDRDYLDAEGITAILELPFFLDGRVAGLVGFDCLGGTAPWQPDDIPMLRSVAALTEHVVSRSLPATSRSGSLDGERDVFERSPIAIVVVDADANVTDVNLTAARLLGQAVVRADRVPLRSLFFGEDRRRFDETWEAFRVDVDLDSVSLELQLAGDAAATWVRIDALASRGADGRLHGATIHVWDLSEHRRMSSALTQSETRLRSLVEVLPEAILLADVDGNVEYVNRAAHELRARLRELGPNESDAWPALPEQVLAELQLAIGRARRNRESGVVAAAITHESDAIWLEFTVVPESESTKDTVLVVARETTDEHRHRAALEHQASHDDLTGLPNRVAFLERLRAECLRIGGARSSVAVLFVDLDDFKVINDTLGHSAGDDLLQLAADRLRGRLRGQDVLARFGGDEFTVLVTDVDVSDAVEVAEIVRGTLAEPATVGGRRFDLAASVGIAIADRRVDAADLLRWADAALYEAKADGRDRVVCFDDALRARLADRTALELDLQRAVDAGQIVVHYQPEVDLSSGAVVGVEALVRWDHPERGLLQPDAFIGASETNGSIRAIGRAVLDEACAATRRWIAAGLVDDAFVVRVNVSPVQLEDPSFVAEVAGALDRALLPATQLSLEVTETAVMQNAATAQATLEQLRALGVRLAIDDFGTGYSSLKLLRDLPIEAIKIDRSFVSGLPGNHSDLAIVRSVLNLADLLGLSVTAEGVETSAQRAALLALGCARAQGYHFARPVPELELPALLRAGFGSSGA